MLNIVAVENVDNSIKIKYYVFIYKIVKYNIVNDRSVLKTIREIKFRTF